MGAKEVNRVIVKEVLLEDFLKAILYQNGVIEIVWDKSIKEIDVIHLQKMQQAVFELGGGKKMPLYFTVPEFTGISSEARKYATTEEGTKYTLATTVLVDNPAKKLLLNFFMNVNKPRIPTKGFTKRDDCFSWLEKISSENLSS